MNLPKVPGTQIRGTTYHFNLPIPTLIHVQHPDFPAGVMRGSLRTSDPKVAASRVGEQRAIFDRQVSETRRLADRDRILGSLGQDDRDLLAEIGGAGKLMDTLKGLRQQAALMLAGAGAEVALLRETTDTSDHVLRLAEEIDTRETQAAQTTITAETRRLKRVAETLGESVPPPPKGIDEGGEGIRELAEKFADAHKWTIQNRESLALTVRRWIELHGDMPLKKWERRHLDQFDELLTQFPTTNGGELRKLSIRKIVDIAARDKLAPISAKTRGRYSDHMKALSKYAVNKAGLIQADPFAGYELRKVKEKFSEKKVTTISYTPEQVDLILHHCAATFDKDVMDHWLPLIAAFSGARREEIGQMLVKDIYLVGNIHVMAITDKDPAQKVKNKHSMRITPIPSVMINAGFLDYVERRRKDKGHFLFLEDVEGRQVMRAEVEQDNRGRLTERYGHRFARQVRDKLGLKLPGLNLHSLRHSWTDAARRAKIDPEIRRLIAGRLDEEDYVEAGYGGNDLLAEKLEALEKVAGFVRA